MSTLIPYLSFIGIIIGAALQYIFTRQIEYRRALRDMKTRAYMDYLQGVCEQAQISKMDDKKAANEKLIAAFTKVADAKARICLYGSKQVIKAFSEFERFGASMATKPQRESFVVMTLAMRKDAGLSSHPEGEAISMVLLGRQ